MCIRDRIVATYGEDGTPDAMNVAYGGIVNSNRIQINIGVRHKTSDNIKAKRAFTVGIADEANLTAADYVGIVSGHDEPEKIAKSGFHLIKSEFVDAPVIEELPISLECRVEEINQYNATLRIVAEIVNVSVDEKILDEKGNINPAKLKAISYDPVSYTHLDVYKRQGIIEYNFNGVASKKDTLVKVKQTLLSIKIQITTNEITSNTIVGNLVEENEEYVLYYTYITNPKSKYSKENPIQYGTCLLYTS